MIMDIIIVAISVIILLFIIIGGYTFFAACGRKKEYPWTDLEAMAKIPAYTLYCHVIEGSLQWLTTHSPREISVTSKDGLTLYAYWIPANNAKGTILLAHGYRSTMLVDFGKVLDMYHTQGMNLLLPFQRCHGKSEGKFITFGDKESQDMQCWLSYHNEKLCQCPVVLSGLSMGASTVMYMLDQSLPDNVKAAIVDCGFTSPAEIIGKVFTDTTHLPSGLFIRIADVFARIFAHFSLYAKDTRQSLSKNTLPILMIHGKSDDFVPCQMSIDGFRVCTGDKKLILVDGAGHGLSYLKGQPEYLDAILDILDKLN